MNWERSRESLSRAERVIPGGVNSPVRAYRSVGGTPPFMKRGWGCNLEDEDEQIYVDLVLSYGPLILGHDHPEVREKLIKALAQGTSFGAPTVAEIELAELITKLMPAVEKVRLVNSGTEACMSALRLARAATGRSKLIKFRGCYHGHADSFLVKAGSGALTLGAPDSPGVPKEVAQDTLVAEYNDLESVARLLGDHRSEVAAIFVEPVAGNMGCVLPKDGFLEGLRALCDDHGTLLVFDEVMTGFRVGPGGYQGLCGIKPDLSCLGKVIGGGLPVGAFGGRADLMDQVAPAGSVYQAGTLSGNPLAVAAGLATLDLLGRDDRYQTLEDRGSYLESGLLRILEDLGVTACVNRQGSMLCLYLGCEKVESFADAEGNDHERFRIYHRSMLEQGIHLPPSPYEAWFLSTSHDEEDLDSVLEAARTALSETAS